MFFDFWGDRVHACHERHRSRFFSCRALSGVPAILLCCVSCQVLSLAFSVSILCLFLRAMASPVETTPLGVGIKAGMSQGKFKAMLKGKAKCNFKGKGKPEQKGKGEGTPPVPARGMDSPCPTSPAESSAPLVTLQAAPTRGARSAPEAAPCVEGLNKKGAGKEVQVKGKPAGEHMMGHGKGSIRKGKGDANKGGNTAKKDSEPLQDKTGHEERVGGHLLLLQCDVSLATVIWIVHTCVFFLLVDIILRQRWY